MREIFNKRHKAGALERKCQSGCAEAEVPELKYPSEKLMVVHQTKALKFNEVLKQNLPNSISQGEIHKRKIGYVSFQRKVRNHSPKRNHPNHDVKPILVGVVLG